MTCFMNSSNAWCIHDGRYGAPSSAVNFMMLKYGNKFSVSLRGLLVTVSGDAAAGRFGGELDPPSGGSNGGANEPSGADDALPDPPAEPEVIGEPKAPDAGSKVPVSGAAPAPAGPCVFPGVSGAGFAYRPGVAVTAVNSKLTEGEDAVSGTVGGPRPGPPAPLVGDVRSGEPDRSGEAAPRVSRDQMGSFDNAVGTMLAIQVDSASIVTTVAGMRTMAVSM